MKYLLLFLIFTCFFGIAFAIPPFDSQEIFDFSKTIVVGEIISVDTTFSPTFNLYQIKAEKFLKNPQDSEIVLAAAQKSVFTRSGISGYSVGDRALFFLTESYVKNEDSQEIFSIHPTSRYVDPKWDECDIFSKDISSEHWTFGGVGSSLEAHQENKTSDFVTGKQIVITYDLSNPTPDEKKTDFGMIIKNNDDTDSLYIFSEISNIVLEPCTSYHTLTWTFTPSTPGRHSFEFSNLMGSTHALSMEIKSNTANEVTMPPPLKQIKNGVEYWKVKCNDGLIRIFKSWDLHTPACVFPDSIPKLNERGWQTLEDER